MDESIEPRQWNTRVADLWARIDSFDEREFVVQMKALVAERPDDDAMGLYEMGSAYDSTGSPDVAVPLYRKALAAGLDASHRVQATIQLASSLRNLGEADESVTLLKAERARGAGEFDDAVAAFLALALTSAGREREALSIALSQLATHMTRFRRSLETYSKELS